MDIKDLILKTRSFRRFDESHRMETETFVSLIDLARISASGANRQPLKYLIYNTSFDCNRIFPSLVWAAYLTDWDGPEEGERPTGYIVILGDKSITDVFGVDHGIAAHSIMLGATEAGLGGCIIASIRRETLRKELEIPDNYDILLVLAIGRPVEKVILDDMINGDVKYWRDSENNHHVPKRRLDDLIINL